VKLQCTQARSENTKKNIKTLGGWGPHWGAYTAPQLQAFPKPHPALSTSGWGEATEGPQVTKYQDSRKNQHTLFIHINWFMLYFT